MVHTNQDVGYEDPYFSGDTLNLEVVVENSDGGVKDITDASIDYALADEPGGSVEFEKSTDDGITITNEIQGEFVVSINPDDTESIAGTYYHECELAEDGGDISTVFTGRVKIREDIVNA